MRKMISISFLFFVLIFPSLGTKVLATDITTEMIAMETWHKIYSHINTLINYEKVIYYHIHTANEQAKERCENYHVNEEMFKSGLLYRGNLIKALVSFRDSLEEIAVISNLKGNSFNETLFLMSTNYLRNRNPLWNALKEKGDEYEEDEQRILGLSAGIYAVIDDNCK